MPLSVLNRMEADHCISLSEMGSVLDKIIHTKEFLSDPIPADILAEAEIAERMISGIDVVQPLGNNSVYTCPDCGGVLFNVKNGKIDRYRCHTGHTYSEKDLEVKQAENLEAALWVALRMMEERKNLIKKLEEQTRGRGFSRFANDYKEKHEELQFHIDKIKELLFITQKDDDT